MKVNIDKIKEQVAEEFGYNELELPTKWNFAMMITYRKKRQLQMYERVIEILLSIINQ